MVEWTHLCCYIWHKIEALKKELKNTQRSAQILGKQRGGYVKSQTGGAIPKIDLVGELATVINQQTDELQTTLRSNTEQLLGAVLALQELLAQGNADRAALGNALGQGGGGGGGGRGTVEFDGEIDL